MEPDVAAKAACRLGFPKVSYFRHAGAHGFFLANAWDVVVACRGTEPHDWNDIRANVNLWMEVAETVGKVHRVFKREMDRLWPKLEAKLVPNRLPLWFTGHSLGGGDGDDLRRPLQGLLHPLQSGGTLYVREPQSWQSKLC